MKRIQHAQIQVTDGIIEVNHIYEYCEIPPIGKAYYADVKVLDIEDLENGNIRLNVAVINAQQGFLPLGFSFKITTSAGEQTKGLWKLFDLGSHSY